MSKINFEVLKEQLQKKVILLIESKDHVSIVVMLVNINSVLKFFKTFDFCLQVCPHLLDLLNPNNFICNHSPIFLSLSLSIKLSPLSVF